MRMAASPAGGNGQANGDRNRWDFLTVLVVVPALVVLTIFLAVYFKNTPSTTATILGIVVPAFAAIFGASLGNAAGKVSGRREGRQQVKAKMLPRLADIQGQAGDLVRNVRMHAENPTGSRDWLLSANFAQQPVTLMSDDDMDKLARDIDAVRGYLEDL